MRKLQAQPGACDAFLAPAARCNLPACLLAWCLLAGSATCLSAAASCGLCFCASKVYRPTSTSPSFSSDRLNKSGPPGAHTILPPAPHPNHQPSQRTEKTPDLFSRHHNPALASTAKPLTLKKTSSPARPLSKAVGRSLPPPTAKPISQGYPGTSEFMSIENLKTFGTSQASRISRRLFSQHLPSCLSSLAAPPPKRCRPFNGSRHDPASGHQPTSAALIILLHNFGRPC